MNTDIFWAMIENARQKSISNPEQQQWEHLVDALCDLSLKDIQEFGRILWLKKAQAYRADIWEAAFLVACHCGDDSFTDFHNWLIAQGRFVYEKTLEDPENLADFVDKKNRFDIFEDWMHSTPELAYARKTQQPISDVPRQGYPYKPVLTAPLTPEEDLPAKYPRIIAKIGDCDDEELFQ